MAQREHKPVYNDMGISFWMLSHGNISIVWAKCVFYLKEAKFGQRQLLSQAQLLRWVFKAAWNSFLESLCACEQNTTNYNSD